MHQRQRISRNLERILSCSTYNGSPLRRMTAHNRNRNCNDPPGSVGGDFVINILATFSELLEGSHLETLIKKSAVISK